MKNLKELMLQIAEELKATEVEKGFEYHQAYTIYDKMWEHEELNNLIVEGKEDIVESVFEDICTELDPTHKKHFNYIEYK